MAQTCRNYSLWYKQELAIILPNRSSCPGVLNHLFAQPLPPSPLNPLLPGDARSILGPGSRVNSFSSTCNFIT